MKKIRSFVTHEKTFKEPGEPIQGLCHARVSQGLLRGEQVVTEGSSCTPTPRLAGPVGQPGVSHRLWFSSREIGTVGLISPPQLHKDMKTG